MAIDILGSVKSWMLETINDEAAAPEVKAYAKETLEGIQTLESEEVEQLIAFFSKAVTK